jgi:hypothetical protein
MGMDFHLPLRTDGPKAGLSDMELVKDKGKRTELRFADCVV